jgi:phosphomannomutase
VSDKSAARDRARRLRRQVDLASASEAVVAGLTAWEGWDGDSTVLLYVPLPDEIDVTSLAGPRAALTRLGADGRLTIHPFDAPRERHPLGFDQPTAEAPTLDPGAIDVVLAPGLAFDDTGTRLGRGGGHYDRLLRLLRDDVVLVGVAPEVVTHDRLPVEAHDIPMTHLATESGVWPIGRLPAVPDDLVNAAKAWIASDPDPVTRAELSDLVASGGRDELQARMGSTLRFGTAGIRGVVGAGSGRMNRAVVIRTTAGLAEYLKGHGRGDGLVVLGYDGRTTSRAFAEDTAGVLAAAGIAVRYFPGTAPTPLVAFVARELGATAAVVVTASHNPPADNGYKVYDANGAQIIPPVDAAIGQGIERAAPANRVPRIERAMDGAADLAVPLVGMEDRYVEAVLDWRQADFSGPSPHVVYTAMHGVGGELCVRLLAAGGHASVTPVREQFEPDGTFPTVAFPNPEEPGAMDLAEALGAAEDADVVIANDPDADRLAVSVPTPDGWRRLTGNEIGVLLADFVLERRGQGEGDLVINSVVSSPMLAAIAAGYGARFEQTLTGFKWIANAGLDLESDGFRFVFGYEEALGYTVGPVVRDKDGISAALWFTDLVAAEAERGRTVLDRLRDLWKRHGLWMSAQYGVRRIGAEGGVEIAMAMGRLRTHTPSVVGGRAVTRVEDFANGASDRPRWLPAANLVVLHLEGGSRVLARPSGTEPKLKFYADVRGSGDEKTVQAEAAALARELAGAVGL